jgi:hypothetical protein
VTYYNRDDKVSAELNIHFPHRLKMPVTRKKRDKIWKFLRKEFGKNALTLGDDDQFSLRLDTERAWATWDGVYHFADADDHLAAMIKI